MSSLLAWIFFFFFSRFTMLFERKQKEGNVLIYIWQADKISAYFP